MSRIALLLLVFSIASFISSDDKTLTLEQLVTDVLNQNQSLPSIRQRIKAARLETQRVQVIDDPFLLLQA